MSITVNASGTQTATIGVEHTLANPATSATWVYVVDTTNMASGDLLELRMKCAVLNAGAVGVAYKVEYDNAQPTDSVISFSVPLPSDQGVTITLKQTQGVGRDYAWKLLAL